MIAEVVIVIFIVASPQTFRSEFVPWLLERTLLSAALTFDLEIENRD